MKPGVKAAVLPQARGAVEIRTVDVGEPGPGEVLVRMEACGICHSDLFVSGLEKLPLAPVTLGHEGIGRVEALGEGVTGWKPGDRVGMTFLGTTCGACEWCGSADRRFCAKQTNFGYSLNGALAEYALAPAAVLVAVPEELAAVEAAPLCCAGWTAWSAVQAAVGRQIALFGYGGLGHLALQMARHRGLRVAVVDLSEEKLEMARANGAEAGVQGENAGRTLQKQYGGMDTAIVLTPSPAAIQQAFRSLKRRGTLVLVGVSTNQFELPMADTVVKGITVKGSYLGTGAELAEVFELARGGVIRPHVNVHGLADTPGVLESMRRGEILGRAVIAFG